MKVIRRSKIRQILEATKRQMFRAVSAGGAEALETAQSLVPVAKGDLKSTLQVTDDAEGSAEFSAGGRSKVSEKFVDYESHVEFGSTHKKTNGETYSIPAQPFFRPALDAGRRKMKQEMRIVEK